MSDQRRKIILVEQHAGFGMAKLEREIADPSERIAAMRVSSNLMFAYVTALLRLTVEAHAAEREIWRASDLQRALAAAGLVISKGKMSKLWAQSPISVRLDDLDVLCAVLRCEPSELLVPEPDFDVDAVDEAGLWPQPATDTVSAVSTATVAATARETLIASRSFQADSGDTVDPFPNRTVHRFVSPNCWAAPGREGATPIGRAGSAGCGPGRERLASAIRRSARRSGFGSSTRRTACAAPDVRARGARRRWHARLRGW